MPRCSVTFFFLKEIGNKDRKQVLAIWECFFKKKTLEVATLKTGELPFQIALTYLRGGRYLRSYQMFSKVSAMWCQFRWKLSLVSGKEVKLTHFQGLFFSDSLQLLW